MIRLSPLDTRHALLSGRPSLMTKRWLRAGEGPCLARSRGLNEPGTLSVSITSPPPHLRMYAYGYVLMFYSLRVCTSPLGYVLVSAWLDVSSSFCLPLLCPLRYLSFSYLSLCICLILCNCLCALCLCLYLYLCFDILGLNSATVCTLTVPVPSLVKGGGRRH